MLAENFLQMMPLKKLLNYLTKNDHKFMLFLVSEETEMEVESPPEPPPQRIVMKHNTVPNRMMQQ